MQANGGSIRAAQIDRGLLDSIANDLSSVIGLWNESVVRGPAWHFGEIGRRLERVFGVIDGVRGALALSTIDPASLHQDYDAQRLIEIVLATNESLVAYRRRYRSDVEFGLAMDLVISDGLNPRAAMAALAIVRAEAEALDWAGGVDARRPPRRPGGGRETRDCRRRRWPCSATSGTVPIELARGIVSEFLASPVDPRVMGHSQ